jgi:hypothetical protein
VSTGDGASADEGAELSGAAGPKTLSANEDPGPELDGGDGSESRPPPEEPELASKPPVDGGSTPPGATPLRPDAT